MRFDGKTVIVTGGSSSIVLACVHHIAELGANVFNADTRDFSIEDGARLAGRDCWIRADLGGADVPQHIVD